MTKSTSGKADTTRAHYDRAAAQIPGFTLMNYGFSASPEATAVPRSDPEFYCLRLYEHAVRGTDLEGADVVEVSCGRGGGAAFLARTFAPRRYVGIDLSEENVRLARERHAAPNLEFEVGHAESLGLPDASFDVVVNVEASHLYDDRRAFFREAWRVLRPGGRFCYTDGCWRDDDVTPDLRAAGFDLLDAADITPNVMRALELDSARREAIVDALPSEDLRREYKDWSGVVGFRAYRRFETGETRYFSYLLKKP